MKVYSECKWFHGYLLDALNIENIFPVLHYPFRLDGYTEGKEAVPLFYYSISPPPPSGKCLNYYKTFKKTHQLFSGKYLQIVCTLRLFHIHHLKILPLRLPPVLSSLYPDAYPIPISTSLSSHPFLPYL